MEPVRLIKFEADPAHAVYCYTTWTEEEMAKFDCFGDDFRHFHLSIWDHGGEDYEVFARQILEGTITEITSLNQVPEADRNIFPYTTDEKDERIEELWNGLEIEQWFKDNEHNERTQTMQKQ